MPSLTVPHSPLIAARIGAGGTALAAAKSNNVNPCSVDLIRNTCGAVRAVQFGV